MKTGQLGFSFDPSRCSGCMACMSACFDQNDMPGGGSTFRHVTRVETGAYPDAGISYVSLACAHCGDAPCVKVCPTNAIFRDPERGVVLVNEQYCMGCHACAAVCPFGAPQFPDGRLMRKCDMCIARVGSGLEPACVRTCPTKALGFAPVDALSEEKARAASLTMVSAMSLKPSGGKA